MNNSLEAAPLDPSLGLLVDRTPGWEVAGQVAPGSAGAHQPAQGVEDLAQGIVSLGSLLAHQAQIGGYEGPLVIGNVTGIGLAAGAVQRMAHIPQVYGLSA